MVACWLLIVDWLFRVGCCLVFGVWCLLFVVRRLMVVVLRVVCWLLCIGFIFFVCGVLSVVGCCLLLGVCCVLPVDWSLLFVVCMVFLCGLCFVCCVRFDVCSFARSLCVVRCLLLVV